MSILRNMRDIAANLALVEELDALRTEQLDAALQGKRFSAAELSEREQLAVRKVVTKFYGNEVSGQLGFSTEQQERRDHYKTRSTAVADEVALETHRILSGLPIVGLDGQTALEAVRT
jgi:hypothetical protein